jgi:hypothetical protein
MCSTANHLVSALWRKALALTPPVSDVAGWAAFSRIPDALTRGKSSQHACNPAVLISYLNAHDAGWRQKHLMNLSQYRHAPYYAGVGFVRHLAVGRRVEPR